jgi:ribonuclease BN (tRNA processing enzyme)
MTLITLENDTNILIDCNVKEKAADETTDDFDCFQWLMDNLPQNEDGIRLLDAFVLTHHDIDHCRGAENYFNLCSPDSLDEEKIFIKELIVAPKLITAKESDLGNESAKKLRKEAKRRLALYSDEDDNASNEGNRIQIIGYSSTLTDYNDLIVPAGKKIEKINGKTITGFEIFVLGPVKKDNDDKEAEVNDTSIVLKLSFIKSSNTIVMVAGGDETCDNLVDIINKNSDLKFDILIAPHHCSWHSISNEDSKTGNPHKTVSDFLEESKDIAHIIASSKPIKRNDDNPPSYRAMNEYKRHISKDDRFYCLGEYPEENDTKPLIFIISNQGVSLDDTNKDNKSSNVLTNSVYTPKTYGKD